MKIRAKSSAAILFFVISALVMTAPAFFPSCAKNALAEGIGGFLEQMDQGGKDAPQPETAAPGSQIKAEILVDDDEDVNADIPAEKTDAETEADIEELLERMRKIGNETGSGVAPEDETIFAIPELEERATVEPTEFNLDGCIASALESNKLLRQKQSDLDKVDGQDLVDKSRFRPHLDLLGGAERKKSSMLKSFYPTLNPPTSISSSSVESGGTSSSSLSGDDLSSLTGLDSAQISDLASQFGVDVSQFGFRRADPVAPAPQKAGNRAAAQQVCFDIATGIPGQTQQVCVDIPEGTFPTSEEIVNAIVQNALGITPSDPSERTTDNEFHLQLSKRILEFGKEAGSTLTVRSNLRSSLHNFEQNRREIVSGVRTTFFLVLLKERQIHTRQKLMREYEDKLTRLQKRFEVAKDVPRLDVLTAELDVLNEKLRINGLRNDLVNFKLDLLQLMGRPMMADEVLFEGEFQPFKYALKQIVDITKKNSYQLAYLEGELVDQQRRFDDIVWDYRPSFSSKFGVENRFSTVGMALNKSGGTYGLDLGVQHYLNLPESAVPSGTENRFFIDMSMDYPVYKGTERKGIRRQEIQKLNNLRAQYQEQDEKLELSARKAYQDYIEALERLKLQGEKTEISQKRLEITRTLREHGKVAEFQLDSYRNSFFSDQDRLFTEEENVITAQENLRKIMGVFDE